MVGSASVTSNAGSKDRHSGQAAHKPSSQQPMSREVQLNYYRQLDTRYQQEERDRMKLYAEQWRLNQTNQGNAKSGFALKTMMVVLAGLVAACGAYIAISALLNSEQDASASPRSTGMRV
jgi:hypothetical protein